MKEEFLHYLWKYNLYYKDKLFDNEGNLIKVIHPGMYNRDAGPDFFNAKIMINGTVWAGNVEIHIKSSHFDLHGHNNDPVYNNVILHVVSEIDRCVFNSKGDEVLTTIIRYDPALYERYESLVNNPWIIACQDHLHDINILLLRQWLTALSVERLEKKSETILDINAASGNDWEETFYRMLCRYFGFRVNAEPFEMLARALPFRIIRKHSDNIFQIEALLFGAAGLLEEGLFKEALTDKYYCDLIKEFRILSAKYTIQPIHGWLWKFSRIRPVNFPTVRISQLARMLSVAGGLFSRVLEAPDVLSIKSLLEVSASEYWDTHYVFGKEVRSVAKKTGSQATDILIINAIVPVMFVYGRSRNRQEVCDKAILLLEDTSAEVNLISAEWESAGLKVDSAFYSQALLQLRNEYCRKRRCIDCRIGSELISKGKLLKEDDELILEP
jgi:hypothetical protein